MLIRRNNNLPAIRSPASGAEFTGRHAGVHRLRIFSGFRLIVGGIQERGLDLPELEILARHHLAVEGEIVRDGDGLALLRGGHVLLALVAEGRHVVRIVETAFDDIHEMKRFRRRVLTQGKTVRVRQRRHHRRRLFRHLTTLATSEDIHGPHGEQARDVVDGLLAVRPHFRGGLLDDIVSQLFGFGSGSLGGGGGRRRSALLLLHSGLKLYVGDAFISYKKPLSHERRSE